MNLVLKAPQKFQRKKLFNPEGSDRKQDRQIVRGNPTNLIQLNNVKYEWAIKLWRQMRENFWVAEKYDLTLDNNCYLELPKNEIRAYDGILSYLTFLDSIQTHNIPYLKGRITASEIHLCLAEQISQESLHNQSYQYAIESIIPSNKRDYIYDLWRKDKILFKRCQAIASYYERYINDKTEKNYKTALVANYALEGIYFYNGFMFFYNLSSRGLMTGTRDIIALIHRDELTHVVLYQKILEELIKTSTDEEKESYVELIKETVEHEKRWSHHIIGDSILGITKTSINNYTEYLANTRAKAIGLREPYNRAPNPYKHLEKIADIGGEASSKGNFFDSGITSYNISSALSGWDDV